MGTEKGYAKDDAYQKKQQAFILYTLFLGDAVKTGHALSVPPAAIATLAKEEGWDDHLSELAKLRNSDKPGDLERALNRAVNYVQAHTMRNQIERVLDEMKSWTSEELRDHFVVNVIDKAGNTHRHFSCKPLSDLTSALEKAHMMSYFALSDSAQDRSRRKEESDDGILAATALHTQIATAMSNIPRDTPGSKLLEAQQQFADDLMDLDDFAKKLDFDLPPKRDKKAGEDNDPPLELKVPE